MLTWPGLKPVLKPVLKLALLQDLALLCLRHTCDEYTERQREFGGLFVLFVLTLELHWCRAKFFSASPWCPQGKHVTGRWVVPEEPGVAQSMPFTVVSRYFVTVDL